MTIFKLSLYRKRLIYLDSKNIFGQGSATANESDGDGICDGQVRHWTCESIIESIELIGRINAFFVSMIFRVLKSK